MVTFRFATQEDVPALKALVESAYRGDSARQGWTHEADLLDDQRIAPEELAAMIANPDQRIILGCETDAGTGRPVGCVAITRLDIKGPEQGSRAYLGLLCVSPALQAAGFGRRLIAEAEAQARALFCADTMEMTVISRREDLIAWYERRGYARSGEMRPFPSPAGAKAGLTMAVLAKPLGRQHESE